MNTRNRRTTVASSLLFTLWVASAFAVGEDSPSHLTLAEQLVRSLHGVADNHYGGGKRHIDWDPASPSARVVCSSFATLLIEKAYDLNDDDIAKMGSGANPMAKDYFEAVGKDKAFERISKFRHVRPGDFLFVKYTDGHVSRNGVEDTGHVMLVASNPEKADKRGDAPPKSEVYTLQIIDSSASGHGPKDTRHLGPNKYTGGVGEGTVRIAIDPTSDQIVAYSWSDQSKSEYFSAPGRIMIAARLNIHYFKASQGSRQSPK